MITTSISVSVSSHPTSGTSRELQESKSQAEVLRAHLAETRTGVLAILEENSKGKRISMKLDVLSQIEVNGKGSKSGNSGATNSVKRETKGLLKGPQSKGRVECQKVMSGESHLNQTKGMTGPIEKTPEGESKSTQEETQAGIQTTRVTLTSREATNTETAVSGNLKGRVMATKESLERMKEQEAL